MNRYIFFCILSVCSSVYATKEDMKSFFSATYPKKHETTPGLKKKKSFFSTFAKLLQYTGFCFPCKNTIYVENSYSSDDEDTLLELHEKNTGTKSTGIFKEGCEEFA